MTNAPESSMMTPAIEKLMSRTKSKFLLVTLAARRAREITQQDDNMQIGSYVSRRVESVSTKNLSVAFEEINEDKVRHVPKTVEEIRAEIAEQQRLEEEANAEAAAAEETSAE